jgi:hypothetical protein
MTEMVLMAVVRIQRMTALVLMPVLLTHRMTELEQKAALMIHRRTVQELMAMGRMAAEVGPMHRMKLGHCWQH